MKSNVTLVLLLNMLLASAGPCLAQSKPAKNESQQTQQSSSEPSSVAIKSNPDGADIMLDGKFVGNAPSTVRVAAGEHVIRIEKSGFRTWQRQITVTSAGNVTIEGTLEKAPENETVSGTDPRMTPDKNMEQRAGVTPTPEIETSLPAREDASQKSKSERPPTIVNVPPFPKNQRVAKTASPNTAQRAVPQKQMRKDATNDVENELLVHPVAVAAVGSPQSQRRYSLSPSSVEQGKEFELTIRSVVCSSNDLVGADLNAPLGSGITVTMATGVHDCTMIARIVVDRDAPVDTAALRITKQGSLWGLINLSVRRGLNADQSTLAMSKPSPTVSGLSPEASRPSPDASRPSPDVSRPSPALALNQTFTLTEQEKREAIRIGLNAKGRFTGLNLSDTGRSISNAMVAMGNSMGNGSKNTPSGTGFSVVLYTPKTWVAQQASNAAKRYEAFTIENITSDMISPVLRVIVHPDTPTQISGAGMKYTSSVEHVVLRDEEKSLVVQPITDRPFTETVSSALRDVTYQGIEVTFLLTSVNQLRGPKGDKEFLVVVIGNGRTERTFKIKKKHFEHLPYDVVIQ